MMNIMSRQRKPWAGIMLTGAGGIAGVLGATFVVIGLERADQLAGVLGMFIGLAGLGVSVYGLRSPTDHTVPDSAAPPQHEIAVSASPSSTPEPTLRHDSRTDSASLPAARPEATRLYGGDHVEFQGNVFHAPVTGKSTLPSNPTAHERDASA